MTAQKNVAIIGAGIAGLSCATALQSAGFDVTVFEKSRGVSGRLSTRVFEQAEQVAQTEPTTTTPSWQCDHGAQYFTARDPAFNAEVQRWVNANVAQLWQPRLQQTDGVTFKPKQDANKTDTNRYVGYPRNTAPAKWLASSLNIQSETTINHLQKIAQQWQLNSKEHGVYQQLFDAVLLAIPAPQAAVLLQDAAPMLATLAASVKMQACFALMLNFNHPLHCEFDGLFINQGLLSWAARDSAKPGRLHMLNHHLETWVLHALSQWSEAHVDDDKDSVAQQMIAEFIALIAPTQSNSTDIFKHNLHSHTLHRWLYADCTHYLNKGCQLDRQHNIGLCGDWLNGGKVQGAWLSGLMLAKQWMDE